VDRLWSITEDLNILYKENWTRLAAQEVQLFQVSIHKHNNILAIFGALIEQLLGAFFKSSRVWSIKWIPVRTFLTTDPP